MSKQYSKECVYCHKSIKMSDEMGSWRAFDLNSSKIHECKKQNSSMPATSNGNQDLSLEIVLKRLESIGITIDLGKLRNLKV